MCMCKNAHKLCYSLLMETIVPIPNSWSNTGKTLLEISRAAFLFYKSILSAL